METDVQDIKIKFEIKECYRFETRFENLNGFDFLQNVDKKFIEVNFDHSSLNVEHCCVYVGDLSTHQIQLYVYEQEREDTKEGQDNKEIFNSFVGCVKEEKYKLELDNSDDKSWSIDVADYTGDDLSASNNKAFIGNKEEIYQHDFKPLFPKNGDPPSDKINLAKKSNQDTFLWCIKEGILKTVKQDSCLNEDNYKYNLSISEKTSQGNLSEHIESYSDVECSIAETSDLDTQGPSNIESHREVEHGVTKTSDTQASSKKKRKSYYKPLKYVCPHCDKRFPQSDLLKYHIMVHTGNRPLECNYCFMRFRRKISLNVHQQMHTGKKYSCKICNKKFVSNYNMKIHMLLHENKRAFKCSLCSSGFNTRMLLYNHITQVHSNNKANLNITNNKSFMIYECNDCNKKFKLKESLRCHIKNVHLEKTYNCNVCGIESSNKYCSNHEQKPKESFTCAVCKLMFSDKQLFIHHIKYTHPTNKPYGCSLCNASFKERSNLKAHFEVHHKTDNDTFVCDICSMSFNRKVYLYRHSKIHTQSDRTISCDLCDIKCRSKTDIRRHLATHFGGHETPYHCEHCDKSFSKPSKLERHQLVHTKERRYKCTLCDKAYRDEGSLKTHLNTHEGNTFTCDLCGFCSINEHSFKRHIRHKICQKKTYECKVCGKVLKSEKFYKNHTLRIHRKDE